MAACGGGADDAPADAPATVSATLSSPPPLQSAVPTTAVANSAIVASCESSGSSGFQAEVLRRVNELRAAGAVCGTVSYPAAPALNWNNLLQQAASGHSSEMAQSNYFSHDSLDGKTFSQRLTDSGYNYSAAGENIAAGDATAKQAVDHWLNSPGHCANMMNSSYRDIGVACASSASSGYGTYWTMDLGR
jgi:uncharacterized protein YkwD